MNWSELNVLVTGGTGSFGQAFVAHALTHLRPRRLIVFSRDELKQHEMRLRWPEGGAVRYFIGDVRDADRLRRALAGVDVVIHAAALKQVGVAEYQPAEAIKTNILGSQNVVDAAIDCGVKRAMLISSDKAVSPANLYGATKLAAEKLFVQGNSYAGADGTRFACVRYGNVLGSRGSVVPLFKAQREEGRLTITDPRMTRFWLTLDDAVRFVVRSVERMRGGEVFVPKLPRGRVVDLARQVAGDVPVQITGIRPGEKLHEVLISEDEARHTRDLGDCYAIEPLFPWWGANEQLGTQLPDGFCYTSADGQEADLEGLLRRVG